MELTFSDYIKALAIGITFGTLFGWFGMPLSLGFTYIWVVRPRQEAAAIKRSAGFAAHAVFQQHIKASKQQPQRDINTVFAEYQAAAQQKK